jgi:hypothetical protein
VIVSILISWTAGLSQVEYVVLTMYCVEGEGEQIFGNVISIKPAVGLVEVAQATCERFNASNSELTNREAPPKGTKRYPSLEALQVVAFFPIAAMAWVRV